MCAGSTRPARFRAVKRRSASLPEDADAHRRRSPEELDQPTLRIRARTLLRNERPGHHREPLARPRHHEESRLPHRHRAGRRRHDDDLPLARVLRLLQTIHCRGQEARHARLDRRRHRLSQRLCRRQVREQQTQYASPDHRAAPSRQGGRNPHPDSQRKRRRRHRHQRLRRAHRHPHQGRQHLLDRPRQLRYHRRGRRARLPHIPHQERYQPHSREGLHPAARGLPQSRGHCHLPRVHPQRLLQRDARVLRHHHPRLPRRRA